MTVVATAFLDGPLGKRVLRKEFGCEWRAKRWCRRTMAASLGGRKLAEVRTKGRLVWSAQEFWDGQHREGVR
jgi:hypothetical protein